MKSNLELGYESEALFKKISKTKERWSKTFKEVINIIYLYN